MKNNAHNIKKYRWNYPQREEKCFINTEAGVRVIKALGTRWSFRPFGKLIVKFIKKAALGLNNYQYVGFLELYREKGMVYKREGTLTLVQALEGGVSWRGCCEQRLAPALFPSTTALDCCSSLFDQVQLWKHLSMIFTFTTLEIIYDFPSRSLKTRIYSMLLGTCRDWSC